MKQKMNNPAEPGVNPYGSAGITQASLRLKMCSINPTMIPVCFAPIPVYPGGEIIISHHLVKLFTRSSQTGTPTKEHTLSPWPSLVIPTDGGSGRETSTPPCLNTDASTDPEVKS